jgi:hypothetical protein
MEIFEPGKSWHAKREQRKPPMTNAKFALAEMAEDWHFFNHGALFTFAQLDTDPVSDWYASQPHNTQVIRQPYKRPVLSGLTALTAAGLPWDHMVCAVRKHDWETLFPFLGGIAAIDHKKKNYFQVFSGDVEVYDPGEVERHSVFKLDLPKITITVFCVDGCRDRWEIHPSDNNVAPPRFVRVDPRPEVVAMGNAVLSGDIEQLKHKDNPAFQPLLDEFKKIVTPGEFGNANRNRTPFSPGG